MTKPAPLELAMTVADFCRAVKISRAFFYKLRAQGLGPREMMLGNVPRITLDAANEWTKAREQEGKAK